MCMHRLFILSLTVISALAIGTRLPAQGYPSEPVEFIVPWPPGDLEDILSQMVAEMFTETYGVDAKVTHRPGGSKGPFPAAIEMANAPADGTSIGVFIGEIPVLAPRLGVDDLNPNPFEALGKFLTYPFVIAARKDADFKTMAELAQYAAAHEVKLAHFGAPLLPTKVTLAIAKEMGFAFGIESTPPQLGCGALSDGEFDVINTSLQFLMPCLHKINVLASISEERLILTPHAPTISELAPNLGITMWTGLFVHADTPENIREKIVSIAKQVTTSDAAKMLSARTGARIYWQSAEDTSQQIITDIETLDTINNMLP